MTNRPTTAKAYVHDDLRNRILDGSLRAGVRLIQSEIAHDLSVSTTPVREALQDLAAEGLVRLDPHKGAMVAQLSAPEVEEIYRIRRTLEPTIVPRTIERMTPAVLSKLDQLCIEMESETDPSRWVVLNRQFHGVMAEVAESPRLASILRSLHDAASPYVAIAMQYDSDMMKSGNHDHRRMLEAVKTEDVEDAVACVIEHMDLALQTVSAELPAKEP